MGGRTILAWAAVLATIFAGGSIERTCSAARVEPEERFREGAALRDERILAGCRHELLMRGPAELRSAPDAAAACRAAFESRPGYWHCRADLRDTRTAGILLALAAEEGGPRPGPCLR